MKLNNGAKRLVVRPLGTTDWRQARDLEKQRIAELQRRPLDPTGARTFGALSVARATEQHAEARRAQVSSECLGGKRRWLGRLAAFFGDKPLRKVPAADLSLSRMFGGISDERRRRCNTELSSAPCDCHRGNARPAGWLRKECPIGHQGAVRARLAGHDGVYSHVRRKALDGVALALESEAPATMQPRRSSSRSGRALLEFFGK